MGDYAIRAQFEAGVPRTEVMRWLDNTRGISGWWSDAVEGEASKTGQTFHVTFPSSPVVFDLEVTEMSQSVVEWHIPDSPPWWRGTTIRFDLTEPEAGKTIVLFTHGGFDPDDPIIQAITPAWVRFLDNLVAVAIAGVPNPAVTN